jgi:hypothetical protein
MTLMIVDVDSCTCSRSRTNFRLYSLILFLSCWLLLLFVLWLGTETRNSRSTKGIIFLQTTFSIYILNNIQVCGFSPRHCSVYHPFIGAVEIKLHITWDLRFWRRLVWTFSDSWYESCSLLESDIVLFRRLVWTFRRNVPERWRWHVPQKRWYYSTKLHGISSQKTIMLTLRAGCGFSFGVASLWIGCNNRNCRISICSSFVHCISVNCFCLSLLDLDPGTRLLESHIERRALLCTCLYILL